MNMKFITSNRKVALITVAVLLAGGGSIAALNQPNAQATDVPPLVQEVNDHDQQLKNHEARITNAENDITDLQNSTNTAPGTNRVAVPSAATVSGQSSVTPTSSGTTTSPATDPAPAPSPSPTPTPDPRTVTAMSDTPRSGGLHICSYTLYDAKANAKQAPVNQQASDPCYQVGDILPLY